MIKSIFKFAENALFVYIIVLQFWVVNIEYVCFNGHKIV